MINGDFKNHFIDLFHAAGMSYLSSLQLFELEPEKSFLDLITCGERLSNYYDYTDDILYDEEMKKIFHKIESTIEDGLLIVKKIKSNFSKVKRRYTLTIMKLLNDYFYSNYECTEAINSLTKQDIEGRVKAAYDLRSRYVHTGIPFGRWLYPDPKYLNEVQMGTPVVDDDRELQRLLVLSPTFIGMERIMRFCLLRFIHLNALRIDDRLDD